MCALIIECRSADTADRYSSTPPDRKERHSQHEPVQLQSRRQVSAVADQLSILGMCFHMCRIYIYVRAKTYHDIVARCAPARIGLNHDSVHIYKHAASGAHARQPS